MATSPLLQPPVPFADFEFAFDPSLSSLFPNPPSLPPSAELFSPSETTDLLGFLDNFGDLAWDPDYLPPAYEQPAHNHSYTPYSNPHLDTTPDPSTSTRTRPPTRSRTAYQSPSIPADEPTYFDSPRDASQTRSTPSDVSATSPTFESAPSPQQQQQQPPPSQRSSSVGPRSKGLLSTPQKRLNHIMSEQKRRNAIRDGYAQLIALLAPAGSAPGTGMPTRGRPKGSGSRGKGQSKGKSGVLFRAVEYCKWLEEDQDALREEVVRVESAAGLQPA